MKKIKDKKKKSLNRIFIFVLSGLIFGTIGVYAATYFPSDDVTYDNTESGLSSNNVQDAIDELYENCSSTATSRDYIYSKESINSNYDGVYKISVESGSSTEVLRTSYGNIKKIAASGDYLYYVMYDNANYDILYKLSIENGNSTQVFRFSSNSKDFVH